MTTPSGSGRSELFAAACVAFEFNFTPVGIEEFARSHPHLAAAADFFLAKLGGDIERVFRYNDRYRGFTGLKAFTEFLGPNSFAGLHKTTDPKRLVLFDVWADGFGLVGPHEVVVNFGHLSIVRLVYEGKFTGEVAVDVRMGTYGGAGGRPLQGRYGRARPDACAERSLCHLLVAFLIAAR